MNTLRMSGRAGRAAALMLILSAQALATAAHAFDPFGGDESLVLQSARSARYGNPAETPLARATAAAQARSSGLAANRSLIGSDVTTGGPLDLIGQGGAQDGLAREIYRPGATVGVGG